MPKNPCLDRRACCVLALLVTTCTVPAVKAQDQHYVGTAYALDSNRVVYREEHFVFDDHGALTRLVLYRCPSGQPFARKWVRMQGNGQAPDFDLIDARTGYREGVRGTQGAREVYTQAHRNATVQSQPLAERPDAVIDAGFDTYVRDHWSTLATGGAHVDFLVPSRLGYVPLRIADASQGSQQGEPVRQLHLSMDAWYGFAAPSLDLTYETADRRLLRFEGIGNIRDNAGKNQRVRIEFPRSAVFPAATPQDVQKAAALPLTASCGT